MALGKLVRGALYVHRDAVEGLDGGKRTRVETAAALVSGDASRWNVARISGDVVALLEYEDFDSSAFPRLLASTRVELATGRHVHTDFSRSDNPLILHRKEQLIRPDDPRVARWAATTRALVDKGLFSEPHRIGRRTPWTDRLARAGLVIVGDEVVAA